ncbi:MAG: AMP-binding protein [Rhodospirillaceae bacterium]|jgi:long-chain acyl-CoA synthetase|nr:AMP-binding protein [Rhodospirillaceae bacterium]MBT5244444.1 AMP-binding protein [Rhodospirillaceae bacterium]MBT5561387.1 AMP-binding protein [Rhodospirillaceae bacterium]MBT6242026.1 AMP-binding protein [Rhodospirillaceae bacterium]MBT7136728.1 AMP-binding protein [Rhodospirillaceae bacterium]
MLTLTSALHRASKVFGSEPAVIDPEGEYTWAEFVDRIARAASILQSLGVKRGERFGIISRNSFRKAEIMHAGYWMGAIPVPANHRLAPPEIAAIFEDAECRVIAVEDHFRSVLGHQALKAWAGDPIWLVPQTTEIDGNNYESLLATAVPAPMGAVDEDDDAVLQYTGGTTGRSKGVRLTHRNVITNALQIASAIHPKMGDVHLHINPMFHSGDLLTTMFTLVGATHVYVPEFSGPKLFEAIQKYRISFAMLIPGMIIKALQEADPTQYDLSSLQKIWYGGSSLSVEWILKTLDAFKNVQLVQCYGQTESAPAVTLLLPADHAEALETGNTEILSSAGRLLPGMTINIVDANGQDVALGQPGEIVLSGPNLSPGYVNRPEETAAVFRDDRFYSGDIGRMDERGYLYVLDRKVDMVVTGGENVYSSEVEIALSQHPDVLECAVTGVPDDTFGEALLAGIVAAPGKNPTEQELIAHCREFIGGFKIPRRYIFLDNLPKSTLHKVLKHELSALYINALDAQTGEHLIESARE